MKQASNRNAVVKYRPDIDGLRCVAILSVLGVSPVTCERVRGIRRC